MEAAAALDAVAVVVPLPSSADAVRLASHALVDAVEEEVEEGSVGERLGSTSLPSDGGAPGPAKA